MLRINMFCTVKVRTVKVGSSINLIYKKQNSKDYTINYHHQIIYLTDYVYMTIKYAPKRLK